MLNALPILLPHRLRAMNRNPCAFCLLLLGALLASACSVKLAALVDKTTTEVNTEYRVEKDVAYGADKEQTLDLYLAKDPNRLKTKNYTVVFLHGGGYYLSDKAREERYIQPYLKKGLNVVNLNYRLKRGIPVATEDLTVALNFLAAHRAAYPVRLDRVVLSGFSAGAHIASMVAVTANDTAYPYPLAPGIRIAGVVNFSGPVGGLNVVEEVFMHNQVPLLREMGQAFFPASTGYAPKEVVKQYEPLTYFDKQDPPFFIWHGGLDDQVPPVTFEEFVTLLGHDPKKNTVLLVPDGRHSPSAGELAAAYEKIFTFLDSH